MNDAILFAILVIGVIAFYGAVIYFIVKAVKKKKARKQEQIKNYSNGTEPICSIFAKHINGLPVAENVGCNINYYAFNIVINISGVEYNIAIDRITDICIKNEVEIQQQYVSSAGGAVAGAMMFGALGAIIGGRTKKIETKTDSSFLIITYTKDEEVKYVGFDVTNSYFAANKIVSHFKTNHSSKIPQKIDL